MSVILGYLVAAILLIISGAVALWKYKAFAIQNPEPIEPLDVPQEAPQAPTVPLVEEVKEIPIMNPDGPKKLELYYETQPWRVTQKWGIHDPATYLRFGFSDHNGIDIAHGYNSRIRAPFDYHVIGTMWQPQGGGMVLSIVSKEAYEAPGGEAHVRLDYLHLAKYIKASGDGNTGDLLCLAGNTGFSTGPHTHIKATWVVPNGNKWKEVEKNKADNTFDQLPYYNGLYAVDYA